MFAAHRQPAIDQCPSRIARWPPTIRCCRTAGAPAVSEFLRKEGEGAWEYAQRVYDLVYVRDIERVAGIAVLWEQRAPPVPLPPAAAVLGDLAEPVACEGNDVLNLLGLNPREVRLVPRGCGRPSPSTRMRHAPVRGGTGTNWPMSQPSMSPGCAKRGLWFTVVSCLVVAGDGGSAGPLSARADDHEGMC